MSHYHLLDQPTILRNAFFPRRGRSVCPDNAFDLTIPVAEDISLHCRFYSGGSDLPTILYFHGNGEIVRDYDEIAPLYHSGAGANLVVAEYRGYGACGGTPTFSTMLEDAHRYFAGVREEMARRKFPDELYIMGRSLGSISALELGAAYTGESKGLIIESGFTSATRIARRLGFTMPPDAIELLEAECRQKVQNITIPSLVIHGEADSLVPLQEAETLYALLGTENKDLVVIAWADHNSLIFEGEEEYFSAIRRFTGGK